MPRTGRRRAHDAVRVASTNVLSDEEIVNDPTTESDRSTVLLNDDCYLKEFTTLFDDAKSITASSSTLTIIWKVCKFCFDEGNPLILIVSMIMNFIEEESWIMACAPSAINFITSSIIAFYLCNEKREVCKSKQGTNIGSLLTDTVKKTLATIFDWVSECSRDEKRTKRIKVIDGNIYRVEHGDVYVKRKGIVELAKFFSSHLRYLREDILVTTLRSFLLSMFTIYKIGDPANVTLKLSTIPDFLRLMYVIYVVVKATNLTNEFQDAQRKYVACLQLTEYAWRNNSSNILQYHRIDKFNKKYIIKVSTFLINFCLIGSIFLAAILSMIVFYPGGFIAWYIFLILANVFLLDFLSVSNCARWAVFRSIFDNPPTGYSTSRNKWIDRFMTVIFYNYGYSRLGFFGLFAWRTLFAIPATTIFFLMLAFKSIIISPLLFNSTLNNSSMNLTQAMQYENVSITIAECMQIFKLKLSTDPVNVLYYLGGIHGGAFILGSMLFIGWGFEKYQKYFERKEIINFNVFERFPFFDTTDCYRSLILEVLEKDKTEFAERNNHDNNNEAGTHDQSLIKNEFFIRSLMTLSILNFDQFQNAWSRFKVNSRVQNVNSIVTELVGSVRELLSQQCNISFYLTQSEKRKLNLLNANFITLQILSTDFASIRWRFNDISNLKLNELKGFHVDTNAITIEEIIAVRLIKKLRERGYPLESTIRVQNTTRNGGNSTSALISNIFERIQCQTIGFEEKRNDIRLFILFCNWLDVTLSQMSSCRIERTFKMLQVEISKTYEDDYVFQ